LGQAELAAKLHPEFAVQEQVKHNVEGQADIDLGHVVDCPIFTIFGVFGECGLVIHDSKAPNQIVCDL